VNDSPGSPTLQDIADRLGLAKSTVSLALRDKGTVGLKTRERVKQAAKEMGYRPDPLLAALVSRRKKSPADQLPVAFVSDRSSSHLDIYYRGCSRRANEFGYRLEHRILEQPKDMKRVVRELWHRGTRGLILHHVPPGDWLHSDPLRDMAVVQCRLHQEPLPFTTVRSDIVRKTHRTMERVLADGHQRIGNVVLMTTPDRSHPEDQDRAGGVLGAQERFKDQAEFIDPLWIHLPEKPETTWRRQARKWVRDHKLDAVICTTDGLADILFYDWASAPAIACTLVTRSHPVYHGMRDNTELIGEKCLELIDQFIRSRRFGIPDHPYEVVIPSQWVEAEVNH
jgi:DNA-binding LacI/PurR family transcriptional regulator